MLFADFSDVTLVSGESYLKGPPEKRTLTFGQCPKENILSGRSSLGLLLKQLGLLIHMISLVMMYMEKEMDKEVGKKVDEVKVVVVKVELM